MPEKNQKPRMLNGRVMLALLCVPFTSVMLLWLTTCFRVLSITFQIAPFSYDVELLANGITVQRTLNALRTQWVGCRTEPPRKFETQFYEEWHRAEKVRTIWPAVRYDIRYVLAPETEQIDFRYRVTPSTLLMVSFKSMAVSLVGLPSLFTPLVFTRRFQLQA